MDLLEVQRIIYERISLLNYTIVDDFALYQEANTPYIQLSSLYINDDNTKNTEGMVVEQYISVYSSYKGKKEILEITQEISNIMKDRMTNEDYSIYIEEDRKTIMLDFDNNGNKFYHAILIFRLYIQ